MSFENLRTAVRGGVILPGDSDFDRAAQPWNTTVAQSVAAIVEVADTLDVATVLELVGKPPDEFSDLLILIICCHSS
ncbi:hypothetical protein ABZ412_15610 [Nocardia sp. NPDC005746]|uniref:hypothetical protein n=1 Tax=Nocardia sp. NPDC005746 TaxID=3157062 RepID=UPI0033F952F3